MIERPFIAALLLSAPAAALAQQASTSSLVLSVDLLAPSNSTRHVTARANALCNSLAGAGTTCAASADNNYVPYGFRLARVWEKSGWQFGPAIGFLTQGPSSGKLDLKLNPYGKFFVKEIDQTYSFSLLAARIYPLKNGRRIGLEAGLGWALAHGNITCGDGGNVGGNCNAMPTSSDVGWLTWELAPKLYVRSWEFGLRYLIFMRGHASPWGDFGLTAGHRWAWPDVVDFFD